MQRRVALQLAAVGILLPAMAHAQVMRGRIVSFDSSRALSGVIVTLTDSAHHDIARTLSNSQGGFVLHARVPGAYTVRALRIGYLPEELGPLSLRTGDTMRVTFPLRNRAVTLQAIAISDRKRCDRPSEGGQATLVVWEETRKALLATVLTRTALLPTVRVVNYERVTDVRSGRQRSLEVTEQYGPSERPYVSPLPPEAYATRGYVEADAGGRVFRAPDADVLLSDSFSLTHCFSVVDGRNTGELGLAFRPLDRQDDKVDVEGTLWLNRATSELTALDFKYTGDAVTTGGGGAISFSRVTSGPWFISRWEVSAPRLVEVKGFRSGGGSLGQRYVRRDSVADIWHMGGRVLDVVLPDGTGWHAPIAAVSGQITSDADGTPVRSAQVSLVGTNYDAVSDSAGSFVIPGVLEGSYVLEVRSTKLSELGIDDMTRKDIVAGDSGVVRVQLRVPSAAQAIAKFCDMPDSVGAVVGTVVDEHGAVTPKALMRARWLTGLGTSGGIDLTARELNTSTVSDASGRFTLCGIPVGQPLRVSAAREGVRSSTVSLEIDRDAHIAHARLTVTTFDRVSGTNGSIAGMVRDATGRPIGDVEIAAFGTTPVRTDSGGRYRVANLPPGSYLIRVRRIGAAPQIERATVDTGESVVLDITLRNVQALGGVHTTANATGSVGDPVGIARRRNSGVGTFLTEEEMAKRNAAA